MKAEEILKALQRKSIEGCTPGPWAEHIASLNGVTVETREEFLRFCGECWDKTANPAMEVSTVAGIRENGEQIYIAILGNGPTAETNARLIAAAPDLQLENAVLREVVEEMAIAVHVLNLRYSAWTLIHSAMNTEFSPEVVSGCKLARTIVEAKEPADEH